MVLSNGRVPYKWAAEFTNQVAFSEMTALAKKQMNNATIGSSFQRKIGIDVGKIKAKMV